MYINLFLNTNLDNNQISTFKIFYLTSLYSLPHELFELRSMSIKLVTIWDILYIIQIFFISIIR